MLSLSAHTSRARRLETILDYDRILVMDDGHIVEYGAPQDLLADKTTQFAKLVAQSIA